MGNNSLIPDDIKKELLGFLKEEMMSDIYSLHPSVIINRVMILILAKFYKDKDYAKIFESFDNFYQYISNLKEAHIELLMKKLKEEYMKLFEEAFNKSVKKRVEEEWNNLLNDKKFLQEVYMIFKEYFEKIKELEENPLATLWKS